MPSDLRTYVIHIIRILLVGGGLAFAGMTVYQLATMSLAPPKSDGFLTGLAFFFGSIIFVLAVGAVSLGIVLPSILGSSDPLGFNRWQRMALKGAAGMIFGGFLLALGFGILTQLQFGFFLWLAIIILATIVVVITVLWRALEVGLRGGLSLIRIHSGGET